VNRKSEIVERKTVPVAVGLGAATVPDSRFTGSSQVMRPDLAEEPC
jgi:hypothetical protein